MKKDIIDLLIERLDNAEKQLSDEAYAFLESHWDIDDVSVYQQACIEYIRIIDTIGPQDDTDKQDIKIMRDMILTINTLISAMNEMF